MEEETIFGLDPGTKVSGFGLIKKRGRAYQALDYGCIRPPASLPLSERYLIIFNALEELLESYRPDAFVVETQYVHKNVQSAIKLGMARGIALIAAKRKKIPVYEYAPTKAKLAVSGKGSATKIQVQAMIQHILALPSLPEPFDAADALSLAICHAQTLPDRRAFSEI